MKSRAVRALLAASLFGSAGADAAAAPLSICLADLPPQMAREVRIPVGCEAIDCCQGCPAGPISWRVRVAGEAIEAVEVKLPSAESVRIPPGEMLLESRIRGRGEEPAPLAALRVSLDEGVLAQWKRASSSGGAATPLGTLSLSIEQLLGPSVVNRHRMEWVVFACSSGGATSACDQIVQTGKAGGDESVILLDARRQPGASGCSDDEVSRAAGTAEVGNLLAAADCPADASVFSSGNAMAFRPALTSWTDSCGDKLPVALAPTLVAPATFFFVTSDDTAMGEWGFDISTVAKADLDLANQIYFANKTGIALSMTPRHLTPFEKLALLPLLVNVVDALANGFDPLTFVCGLPATLESKGLYVKGRLNVYYLPVPGTGMICPDDRNVVFMALNKNPETLAHEFGHSLSLLGNWGHTNDAPSGFGTNNVMWVRANDVRDHFSLGQAFRQNVDTTSMLNVNGVRQELARPCALDADTPECPPLALDWVRP